MFAKLGSLYYHCRHLETEYGLWSIVDSVDRIFIGEEVETLPSGIFESVGPLDALSLSVTFADRSALSEIGARAFASTSLISLLLPDTLREIAPDAFAECSMLRYMLCPQDLLLLPDGVIVGDELYRSDEGYLFLVSDGLYYMIGYDGQLPEELVLPLYARDSIPYGLLDLPYAESVSALTVPDTVEVVLSLYQRNLPNLKTLVIRGKLSCNIITGIERLELLGEVSSFPNLSCDSYLKHLVLGESFTELPERAFASCTALETVTLPSTLLRVGYGCFFGCNSLKVLLIPSSVVYLDNPCSPFTHVGLAHRELPADGHFSGYAAINVKRYIAEGETLWYEDNDGVLFEITDFEKAPAEKEEGEEQIPTEKIYGEYIYDGVHVYDIVDGVYIYRAYIGDKSSGNLVLPEAIDGHRYIIGEEAFRDALWLRSITVRGVDEILRCAFDGCSALEALQLEEGLRYIGDFAFSETALVSVTLPHSLGFLVSSAFYGSALLESVVFSVVEEWHGDNLYQAKWVRCAECAAECLSSVDPDIMLMNTTINLYRPQYFD